MENRTDFMDDFNIELKTLMKNIRSGIEHIEQEKLDIREGQVSPLGKILSEIIIPDCEINSIREISDPRVQKEKVFSFLINEMIFLNTKYPYSSNSKLTPNKWWRAVVVVLGSIENYIKIPYWDIIKEIVKLGSIITGINQEQ